MSATARDVEVLACCGPLDGETLAHDEAAVTARLFKALSDPHRVQIVNLLASRREALCVCEFTEPLGIGQPTVSHHLKTLTAAGLVGRQQRGRWAYYSLQQDVMDCLASVLTSRAPAPGGTSQGARREERG